MTTDTNLPALCTELRRLMAETGGLPFVAEGAHVFVDEAYGYTTGPQTIASASGYVFARLIAAAVNAIEPLCDAVERLTAARDSMKLMMESQRAADTKSLGLMFADVQALRARLDRLVAAAEQFLATALSHHPNSDFVMIYRGDATLLRAAIADARSEP